jgi:hypothetical protein
MARRKPSKSPDDLPVRRSKHKALGALVGAIAATALATGVTPQRNQASAEPLAASDVQQDSAGALAKLVLKPAGSQSSLAQEHVSHQSHSSHGSHHSHYSSSG